MSQIKPINAQVLIEPDQVELKTKMGLYLSEYEQSQKKHKSGTVVSIGPDVKTIKIKDRVVFNHYDTHRFTYENVDLILIDEDKLLAKVN